MVFVCSRKGSDDTSHIRKIISASLLVNVRGIYDFSISRRDVSVVFCLVLVIFGVVAV